MARRLQSADSTFWAPHARTQPTAPHAVQFLLEALTILLGATFAAEKRESLKKRMRQRRKPGSAGHGSTRNWFSYISPVCSRVLHLSSYLLCLIALLQLARQPQVSQEEWNHH